MVSLNNKKRSKYIESTPNRMRTVECWVGDRGETWESKPHDSTDFIRERHIGISNGGCEDSLILTTQTTISKRAHQMFDSITSD